MYKGEDKTVKLLAGLPDSENSIWHQFQITSNSDHTLWWIRQQTSASTLGSTQDQNEIPNYGYSISSLGKTI